MGGSGAFEARIRGIVTALFVGLERAGASGVDIVIATICCAVDYCGTIDLRYDSHEVEGCEGMN